MRARLETEVVVAGSGPAGASVARELQKAGRSVVLVEQGRWHRRAVGRLFSLGTITQMFRSEEGGLMGRGITVGGSSVVYNGNAYDPPEWLSSELRIEVGPLAAETKVELGIKTLPEEFYASWPAMRRLVEAAGELDIALRPQQKFIDASKCVLGCDDCMLGCRRQAKWTAREYIREAQDLGMRLLERTRVERVLFENGRAVGVEVSGPAGIEEVRAARTVISAGGIGTPIILQRSGIPAGEGFFIDPMNVVMGVGKERGTLGEMTFSYASEEFVESDGYLVGTVGFLYVFGAQLTRGPSLRALLRGPQFRRVMGMFTKIGDSAGGRIYADGRVSKPYGPEDREKFRKGTDACRKILIKAGAAPDSIMVATDIGGHPGGSAAVGRVVDSNLQVMGKENLYVCDASVFPKSPGRPPTLTLIALGKWLGRRMAEAR